MVGAEVTELIQGYVIGRTLETTEAELMKPSSRTPPVRDDARSGAGRLWSRAALLTSFFGVSYAILAVIGPALARWGGAGALFLAHGAFMLAIAALLWTLLPRVVLPAPPALTLAGVVRQHGTIYRSPRIAAPAAGFFFYTILYVALLTLLPPMLGSHRALAATAMPLVSIAVSLTLGVWLLGRISAVHLVQGGFAVALLGTALLGLGWGAEGVRLSGALLLRRRGDVAWPIRSEVHRGALARASTTSRASTWTSRATSWW
jgi:hypothetical protein